MQWADRLRLRWSSLRHRSRVDAELGDELRFHLEQQITENLEAGLTPEEARYRALRSIGGIANLQEECRDMRRLNLMDSFMKDLIYAGRTLRKSPLFAVVAILSLGFAIGANAAVFSVINRLLLAPLRVADPDTLVAVERVLPAGGTESEFPVAAFEQFRDHNRTFSGIAAWASSRLSVSLNGEPAELVDVGFYSGDAFAVLGVEPILGRTFTSAEDHAGQDAVAVISDRYWRRRFAGSETVLNRKIETKGVVVTIIGVLPPGFTGLSEMTGYPDITLPFVWQSRFALNDNGVHANIAARLSKKATIEQAQAEANVIFSRVTQQLIDPATPEDRKRELLAQSVQIRPAGRGDHGQWERYKLRLAILMGAVAILLLIACANVANLTLARGAARQREFAIRYAIGAGRLHLIRQLLTESLLLGVSSGLVGLWMAGWARSGLAALLGTEGSVALDGRVLAFTTAVSIASVILFGLAPAVRSSRAGLAQGLTGRSITRVLSGARGLVVA
jgi:predicted permease